MRLLEADIAEAIAGLHAHWYGRGPSGARAYVSEGAVVVVLEETFTPAEAALVARGQTEGIREVRRRFQEAMAEEFVSIVTQATGRQVRSFVSDTDLQQRIAIEVFILGPVLECMGQFADRPVDVGHQDPG